MANSKHTKKTSIGVGLLLALASLSSGVWATDLVVGTGFDNLVLPYSPIAPQQAILGPTSMTNNPANISYIESAEWSVHGNVKIGRYNSDKVLAVEGIEDSVGTPVTGSKGNISSNNANIGGFISLPKVSYLDYTDLNMALGFYRRNVWDVDYPADFQGRWLADRANVYTDTAEINVAFPVNASKTLRIGGGLALNRTSAVFNVNDSEEFGSFGVSGRDNQSKSYQYGFTYSPNQNWQIAGSERSKLEVNIDGTMQAFIPQQRAVVASEGVDAVTGFDALNVSAESLLSFNMPASTRLGASYQVATGAVLGVAWQNTKWSEATTASLSNDINQAQIEALIRAQNDNQINTEIVVRAGDIRSAIRRKTITTDYQDTDGFSLSLQWPYQRATMVASLAWEESPYKTSAQSLYAPSGERWRFAMGGSYPLANNAIIKVGGQLGIVPDTEVVVSEENNRYFANIRRYDFNALVEWVKRF